MRYFRWQPLFQSQMHGRSGWRASFWRIQHERHMLESRRARLSFALSSGEIDRRKVLSSVRRHFERARSLAGRCARSASSTRPDYFFLWTISVVDGEAPPGVVICREIERTWVFVALCWRPVFHSKSPASWARRIYRKRLTCLRRAPIVIGQHPNMRFLVQHIHKHDAVDLERLTAAAPC